MPYFKRTDAVGAMQVVAAEQNVMIHGCSQKARLGDWVVTTSAGKIAIFTDEGFRAQFIEVEIMTVSALS
jgi:hypothetical protein